MVVLLCDRWSRFWVLAVYRVMQKVHPTNHFVISKDFDELLKMAAADKRLASELAPRSYLNGKAESVMQKLVTCVQNTVELYHELHALDRLEHDYRLKQKEQDGLSLRGDSLDILKQETILDCGVLWKQ
ncbi:hypothetical protein Zm00014a_005725 [Zea mays]|uniref:Uncharacterized protein n=2 Tax=Zea mays TaxID=4577 RepID=A0A8J8YAF2_MAIZE|nr:hypothetical protein ZEAMMB73_Zm00001d029712 [Zea mays]PWZ55999.1 hypothetical protein Zm00014a_005725 [Zea mays]